MKKYVIWWSNSEVIEAENEDEAEEILRQHRPVGADEWGVDEFDEEDDDDDIVEVD